MKVPGGELVVKRQPSQDGDPKDLGTMICDAFVEMRRQLENHARRRRGQVKTHEPSPHVRVIRVFPENGFGFLETPEGREIDFHRNSFREAIFEDLELGTEVRFVEERGDKGPQASTVEPVGRHSRI